jgi:hypothetical protein
MERRKILHLPRIEAWSSSPFCCGGGINERKTGIKNDRKERKRGRKKSGREINKEGSNYITKERRRRRRKASKWAEP